MMYIEKVSKFKVNKNEEECKCTCKSSKDLHCSCSDVDDSRFKYLDKFDDFSFDEKVKLFLPLIVFCDSADWVKDLDKETVNNVIFNTYMKTGRSFKNIHYDFSHQGSATVLIEFNAIQNSIIPDKYQHIIDWGVENYLV